MPAKEKKVIQLTLTELEAKSLKQLLALCFNMGSYDYIFPKQADELRADKLFKQLEEALK